MKSDVLTLAAVIFVLGTLISSLDLTSYFAQDGDKAAPPSGLQQGIAVQQ